MREKNIWERIRNSSNCRVLILNLILTLCLNLLLEFTERRSVGEVITFVQERTFVFLYNGFIIFLCFSIVFLVRKRIFAYVFISGCWVLVALIFPVLLLTAGSFMGTEELRESYGSVLYGDSGNLQWKLFPLYPTLKAYLQLLLDSPDFFVMFWNSCRQVFPILGGQLLLGLPAAWALGRFRFRGRKMILYLYMILMILPFQVTMVSGYTVLSFLRVLDTHWSVILPGIFSTFPVFLMTKFFQQIPDTLLEAAKVDGAGVAASFFYIGLPLGIPGVVSSLILNFLEYWNAIEAPMTFLKNKSLFPVSLYLSNITIHDMGTAFAASILIMAPSVFLFACGQNYLEQGILASGLKE